METRETFHIWMPNVSHIFDIMFSSVKDKCALRAVYEQHGIFGYECNSWERESPAEHEGKKHRIVELNTLDKKQVMEDHVVVESDMDELIVLEMRRDGQVKMRVRIQCVGDVSVVTIDSTDEDDWPRIARDLRIETMRLIE